MNDNSSYIHATSVSGERYHACKSLYVGDDGTFLSYNVIRWVP